MSVPLWKRGLNRLDSSIRRFASGASDEAFIAGLYERILTRPADAGALSAGARSLALGLVRRGHVRRALVSSSEYRALEPLWKRSLNRLDSSIRLWKRSLNRFDSSIRRFASGASDEEFIASLYEWILARPSDAGALSAGARSLALGFVRRGQVRRALVSSAEYRALEPRWKRSLNRFDSSIRRFASGESDEAFMSRLYADMLARRPEAALCQPERGSWGSAFFAAAACAKRSPRPLSIEPWSLSGNAR